MAFERMRVSLRTVAVAASLATAAFVGGIVSTPALADQSNPLIGNTTGVTALNDTEMDKVQGSGTYANYYGYYGYLYAYYAYQYGAAAYSSSNSSTQYNYYNSASNYANYAYQYLRYAAYYAYYNY